MNRLIFFGEVPTIASSKIRQGNATSAFIGFKGGISPIEMGCEILCSQVQRHGESEGVNVAGAVMFVFCN